MRDVFELEPQTRVLADDSYILCYPHLLAYFAERDTFDASDLVRGTHMAYGWMPTMLELYPESPNPDLHTGAQLLTSAKRNGALTNNEITSLVKLINNSLVGVSKLLHFVAPKQFAIWDSKIYAFVFEQKPYFYRVNQVDRYREYLNVLVNICRDTRFPNFHRCVNNKVGYDVSPFRAIELVMFLNAPVYRG